MFYRDFIQIYPNRIKIKSGLSEFLKNLDKIRIKSVFSNFVQNLDKVNFLKI